MKQKGIRNLIFTVAGVFLSLMIAMYLNQNIFPTISLLPRMGLLIAAQWIMLIVPAILMKSDGTTLSSIGFTKQNISAQIVVGMLIALIMSLVLTIVPILLGLKEMVGSTQYTQPWQYAYDFAYKTLGVALTEEVVFRGYIFKLLVGIKKSTSFAIAVSSILFGLIHVLNGGIIQCVITALIGAVYCVCRLKIKNCSLLSLIIAHGVYDGLITLWVGIL
ncbi:CPBP family intramembrane metalloprotease [Ruminococcaceae bacterium OttesenSCG-928-L11]|nr:CPBP family intramembrane metalloprotease [Ruminococcaceae bacterium OttesenSCG-928-L11]